MARVTYVKSAQQRYETVDVIDPATGQVKYTPVMRKDGTQKTTRRGGRPVFMKVTRQDRSKPKAMPRCDYPGCQHPQREIQPGEPYKHISPKSGPYGGRTMARHADHPSWNVWEYSSSLSARLALVEHEFANAIFAVDSEDDVRSALDDAANAVREIAEEKREAAQNIEDGFQHATYQSEELTDLADQLDSWADEIEQAEIPEFPEPEEGECPDCGGLGMEDGREEDTDVPDCGTCKGTGQHTPDDPTEEQVDEWRDSLADELTIVGEQPF